MEPFSDNDTTVLILSRLPVKSLVAFMCTAKRWYSFVLDPVFLRIYYQRSKEIPVLILQHGVSLDTIDLLTLTQTGYKLNYKSLDFLPEKVIILSSSKGILCCRSWVDKKLGSRRKSPVTYICNPITRWWVQFRSNDDDKNSLIPGFVFYPFCSSSSSLEASMFKLVNIRLQNSSYFFDIYSSETKKWKTSKEVCKTISRVWKIKFSGCPESVIFANGWFHWVTEYQIITFHIQKELSKVIKLPIVPHRYAVFTYGTCWGESEGYFHYVFAHAPELQVWVLRSYEEEPAWELKYGLNMIRFCDQHSSLSKSTYLNVLTFHEDVLYIRAVRSGVGTLVSYDFKTKTMINHGEIARQSEKDPNSHIVIPFLPHQTWPIVMPFSASLVPLHEHGHGPFGIRRSERNRKRKLLSCTS